MPRINWSSSLAPSHNGVLMREMIKIPFIPRLQQHLLRCWSVGPSPFQEKGGKGIPELRVGLWGTTPFVLHFIKIPARPMLHLNPNFLRCWSVGPSSFQEKCGKGIPELCVGYWETTPPFCIFILRLVKIPARPTFHLNPNFLLVS